MAIELCHVVLRHLCELAKPLTALADADDLADLLAEAGWDSQALGIMDASVFASAVTALQTALDTAEQTLDKSTIEVADLVTIVETLEPAVSGIIQAISSLPVSAGAPADVFTQLTDDLLGVLVAKHFISRYPRTAVAASLLGFLTRRETTAITGSDGRMLRTVTSQQTVDFAAVGKALNDPLGYMRTRLLLDPEGARRLADSIADILGPDLTEALGWAGLGSSYGVVPPDPTLTLTQAEQDAVKHLLLTRIELPGPDGTRLIIALAAGLTDETAPGEGLGLILRASAADAAISIPTGAGALSVQASGASESLLLTGRSVWLADGQTPADVAFQVTYATSPDAKPAVRLGSAGTRLEVDNVSVVVSLARNDGTVDVVGTASLSGLMLAFCGAEGDAFLRSVLPADPIEVRGDLAIDVSLRHGVRVRGGAGLEWQCNVHQQIGPITIRQMRASLLATGGKVSMALSTYLDVALDPITASIDGFGLQATLTSLTQAHPSPVAVGFKPAAEIGLQIKAGPVDGSGMLKQCAGGYAGWGTLKFSEFTLHALALLANQLPDGSLLPFPGWSLLAVITASDLQIQLGLGFTLDGMGGLFGVHRAATVPALQDAVRAGTLGSVLFPSSDNDAIPLEALTAVDRLFPVTPNRYVFGPMAEITWGAGSVTFVRAELALLLELPAPLRLILLGRLSMALPSEDDALVSIHMDALGVIDFGSEAASLDASLYDSSIVGMALTGDMAMRLRWGAQPSFALSIGGFHPKFFPPGNFPALRRLAISLADSKELRIRLEGYLALTSATVQFGARLQLDANVGSLSISGVLSFDALFRFAPTFGLLIDMGGSIAVRWGSTELLSVKIDLSLSGTTPWDAQGVFRVRILWISASKRFHHTWGRIEPPPPPQAIDVGKQLLDALKDPQTWSAQMPTGGDALVSLAPAAPAEGLLAHPVGSVSFVQRVVPLDTPISHFGNAPLAEGSGHLFTVTATITGQTPPVEELTAEFAMADFFDLTDDERLTGDAFKSWPAGLRLGDDPQVVPNAGDGLPLFVLGYDTKYAPPDDAAHDEVHVAQAPVPPVPLSAELFDALLPLGAAARAPARTTGLGAYRNAGVPRLTAQTASVRYAMSGADGREVQGSFAEVAAASRRLGPGRRGLLRTR